MKKKWIEINVVSVFIFLIVVLFPACKKTQCTPGVNYCLTKGQMLIVDLESKSRDGGYCWELTNRSAISVIDSVNYEYLNDEPETSDEVGGNSGHEIWTFKAVNPGKQNLNFVYKRSWENTILDHKEIVVEVLD